MLSYQHAYHAGNLADVHKHAALAWMLEYLTRKDKPLSYIETHAGRGLYDLAGPEARKTGEAAAGIARVEDALPADHPYRRVLSDTRTAHGASTYPGSPLIAATLLRRGDRIDLAELHPAERLALAKAMTGTGARIHAQDGMELAQALTPPDPRRGMMLIDPSYEVKADYAALAAALPKLARKWNVGIIMLWYPILADGRHHGMIRRLQDALPDALTHEIAFPPARKGHGMSGSGLFVVNPPWGLKDALREIADRAASVT